MGKIFRLIDKPSYFKETIELIEKAFMYSSSHRFEIDFAPLIDASNHHQCFIMLNEEDKVISHIALKIRHITISGEDFKIGFIGGVAVEKESRGKGHFQTLLGSVIKEFQDHLCFFLLWSDQQKLYRKFSFELCGTQTEIKQHTLNYTPKSNGFDKFKYADLSSSDKRQIQELYKNSFSQMFTTIKRSSEDWELIERITSADLFVKKENSEIKAYFFQNKGQDLQNIIYEYGFSENSPLTLEDLSHFGTVWSGKKTEESQNLQFQFLLRPGSNQHFSQFIFKITNSKILVRQINFSNEEIFFEFNNELLALNLNEFLQGIFGPGIFEELEIPDLFISGLDSI